MATFEAWRDAYVSALDEVLVADTVIAPFNASNVEYLKGRNVKFRKLSFSTGLQTYSRFASDDDDFTYTYETKTLANDKEKEFFLDWADVNDFPVEDATEILSQFIRIKVNPEIEANFLAKVKAAVPSGNAISTAPSAANIKGQIDTGVKKLAQVGVNSGTIFMSAATALLFDGVISRTYASDGAISNRVLDYNGWKVVQVPDATIGAIDFLFVGDGCAMNIVKHAYIQAFEPGRHTEGDGWLLQYRVIYDAIVLDNKVEGLYVNRKMSDTDILTFSISSATGVVDDDAHTVTIAATNGTDVSEVASVFTLSEGAKAYIGTTEQVTAVTTNTWVSGTAKTIRVVAEDGVTYQDWAVTITVAAG